jgi:hypothetical protein
MQAEGSRVLCDTEQCSSGEEKHRLYRNQLELAGRVLTTKIGLILEEEEVTDDGQRGIYNNRTASKLYTFWQFAVSIRANQYRRDLRMPPELPLQRGATPDEKGNAPGKYESPAEPRRSQGTGSTKRVHLYGDILASDRKTGWYV